MYRKLLALIVLIAAVAAIVVTEKQARHELDGRFRELVAARYPDLHVDRSDVRGQPYLLSRAKRRISTAYAYLEPQPDGARRVLLVQNLDLRDGTAERVRELVTLPYPATTISPGLETTADRSQAVLDGELVTYRARVADGILTVETVEHGADPRYAPAPVGVAALLGAEGTPEPTRVVAVRDGVLVEFTHTDATFEQGSLADAAAPPRSGERSVG